MQAKLLHVCSAWEYIFLGNMNKQHRVEVLANCSRPWQARPLLICFLTWKSLVCHTYVLACCVLANFLTILFRSASMEYWTGCLLFPQQRNKHNACTVATYKTKCDVFILEYGHKSGLIFWSSFHFIVILVAYIYIFYINQSFTPGLQSIHLQGMPRKLALFFRCIWNIVCIARSNQASSNVIKFCACHQKWKWLGWITLGQMTGHLKSPSNMYLPRKLIRIIDPRNKHNVMYNFESNTQYPSTPPNSILCIPMQERHRRAFFACILIQVFFEMISNDNVPSLSNPIETVKTICYHAISSQNRRQCLLKWNQEKTTNDYNVVLLRGSMVRINVRGSYSSCWLFVDFSTGYFRPVISHQGHWCESFFIVRERRRIWWRWKMGPHFSDVTRINYTCLENEYFVVLGYNNDLWNKKKYNILKSN